MQSDAFDRHEKGRMLLNHYWNRTLASIQPFAAVSEKVEAVAGNATEAWVVLMNTWYFLNNQSNLKIINHLFDEAQPPLQRRRVARRTPRRRGPSPKQRALMSEWYGRRNSPPYSHEPIAIPSESKNMNCIPISFRIPFIEYKDSSESK